MKVQPLDGSSPWTDYLVTSLVSGKSYRVALRGLEPGRSYCTCPDFRTNTLGTCKHVMKVTSVVRRKFTPQKLRRPFQGRRIEMLSPVRSAMSLFRVGLPEKLDAELEGDRRPADRRACRIAA